MADKDDTRWSYAGGLDEMCSPGCYLLQLRHNCPGTTLPLPACDEEHYITATLIVTESGTDEQLQRNRMIGQTLIMPACDDGRTRIFTRTLKCTGDNSGWQPWGEISAVNEHNYNTIPLVPQIINPVSIIDITPDMKSWVSNDQDGSVADSLVQVYDEVYQNNRQCIELTSTNKGRFYTPLNTEVDFLTNVLRGSICVQKDYPTSDLGSLEVELYSGNTINASHRAVFSVAYAEMANIQYNEQYARGGWYHWCVNPDALIPPTKRGDDFDITSVTHVGIHPYHTSNIPLKVYISNFSVVRNLLKPGVITIVDNFDASVPAMADYAYSKGVKLNLSIVPNWIGGSNSATLEEINRIKKQGHLIFNHTFDHINDTSSNTELEIVEQITKSAEWMHNNGFNRGKFIISNPSAMFPFAKYKAYMESPLQMLYHHWAVYPNNASDGILLYYPYYPMSRLLNISSLDKCDDAILIAQKAVEKGGIAVNGYHGTFWSADGGTQWKKYIDAIAELDVKHYGIDEIIEGSVV